MWLRSHLSWLSTKDFRSSAFVVAVSIVSYGDLLILPPETLIQSGSIIVLTTSYDGLSVSYDDLLVFYPKPTP